MTGLWEAWGNVSMQCCTLIFVHFQYYVRGTTLILGKKCGARGLLARSLPGTVLRAALREV